MNNNGAGSEQTTSTSDNTGRFLKGLLSSSHVVYFSVVWTGLGFSKNSNQWVVVGYGNYRCTFCPTLAESLEEDEDEEMNEFEGDMNEEELDMISSELAAIESSSSSDDEGVGDAGSNGASRFNSRCKPPRKRQRIEVKAESISSDENEEE